MSNVELRVVIREEDDFLNAYVDLVGEPVLLASIRMTVVRADREVYEDFQALAVKALNAVVKQVHGVEPVGYYTEKPKG